MNTLKFNKESDNRWYVDLPDWEGEKADLEMVAGADKLLDILSNNTNDVSVSFSIEPFDGAKILTHDIVREDEGHYFNDASHGPAIIWLCGVTEFVFGNYPDIIYYSKQS